MKIHKVVLNFFSPGLGTSAEYYRLYARAMTRLGDRHKERVQRKEDIATRATSDKQCLQVGVRGEKIAPHWVSIDLYDTSPLIDHNYDVQDMPFEDESFDFVVCSAVLEHVPYPERAIAEILRVLRPGAEVWIEVPLNQPFHAAPSDYWRVTPEGLRIWMKGFEEEAIGVFSIEGSPFYNGVFYHGRKPGPSRS